MKILHINCSDCGSTGKIILEISQETSRRGYETILCVPLRMANPPIKTYYTSLKYEQGLYSRLCKLGFLMYGFAPLSTYKILRVIRTERPDIVHLHSINCYMVNIYQLVTYLKKNNISTVVTNHAEFFYTGSCAYAQECNQWIEGCKKCDRVYEASGCKIYDVTPRAWRKMYDAFKNFKSIQIVSVSDWVYNRSKQSKIFRNLPNMVIRNGVNTDIFHPTETASIIQKYAIPSAKKYIFHISSSFSNDTNSIKGGKYIIDLAKNLKDKGTIILIAASRHTIDIATLPPNIKFIGKVMNQQELAAFYSLANLTVITSKRETYGMAVAESLCCGTPLVGFLAGGPESVAIKKYTRFIEYGNMQAYTNAIAEMIQIKTSNIAQQISKEAFLEYAAEKMAKSYNNLYEKLLNKD